MKLLIVGSRGVRDFDLTEYVPEETTLIISGGARGMDRIAETYADQHGIEKIIIKPQYERYGRGAPIKRNECMVEMADAVLAVWDGVSRGTLYTIEYAKQQGKSVRVVRYARERV